MRRAVGLVPVLLCVVAVLAQTGDSATVRGIPLPTVVRVASGVGLVQALDCRGRPIRVPGGTASGSGFLVGSRVLMTTEHGLTGFSNRSGSCGYRVWLDGRWFGVTGLRVWGDTATSDRRDVDLATLELSRAAPGHIFRFAAVSPRVDTAVAALGYPLGLPLSIAQGFVIRRFVDDGVPALASRIVVEGGSSGGPVIDSAGRVVALVQRLVPVANPNSDGSNLNGSVDLARWWGAAIASDLCVAHPTGGIPACNGNETSSSAKTAIAVSLRRR